MKVRKVQPTPGNKLSRRIYEVISVEDHKPCDGAISHNTILVLDDNSWVFKWNVVIVD
jgi:hypothetical protein